MSIMTTDPTKTVKLFFCYAREDKALRDELEQHLSLLKRQKQITTWYDREISPGSEWKQEIDTHLNSAHIILLLVSPDFLASDYCFGIEMKRALERHEAGTARVIPIILRSVYWKGAPFSNLQVLPTDALPVTSWPDRDRAFLDITENIHKAVEEIQLSLLANEWLEEGNALGEHKRYEEALVAYDQAIHLDSNFAPAYHNKGNALNELKRYEEALAAYERAIRLDPNDAIAYSNKGMALYGLKQYEEALADYEQAIRLDPNFADAYHNKGNALHGLKRYEEALVAYDQAIRLDPNFADAYSNKGMVLNELKRYEEALAACEQAIRLDPNFAYAYHNKGVALERLGRNKDAQQAFERARQLGYKGLAV